MKDPVTFTIEIRRVESDLVEAAGVRRVVTLSHENVQGHAAEALEREARAGIRGLLKVPDKKPGG